MAQENQQKFEDPIGKLLHKFKEMGEQIHAINTSLGFLSNALEHMQGLASRVAAMMLIAAGGRPALSYPVRSLLQSGTSPHTPGDFGHGEGFTSRSLKNVLGEVLRQTGVPETSKTPVLHSQPGENAQAVLATSTLASEVPGYAPVSGPCRKCGGSGEYNYPSGDVGDCFECGGSGKGSDRVAHGGKKLGKEATLMGIHPGINPDLLPPAIVSTAAKLAVNANLPGGIQHTFVPPSSLTPGSGAAFNAVVAGSSSGGVIPPSKPPAPPGGLFPGSEDTGEPQRRPSRTNDKSISFGEFFASTVGKQNLQNDQALDFLVKGLGLSGNAAQAAIQQAAAERVAEAKLALQQEMRKQKRTGQGDMAEFLGGSSRKKGGIFEKAITDLDVLKEKLDRTAKGGGVKGFFAGMASKGVGGVQTGLHFSQGSFSGLSKGLDAIALKFNELSRSVLPTFFAALAGIGASVGAASPAAFGTLQDSITILMASLGMGMIPVIMDLSSGIQRLAEWFRELDPAIQMTIGKFVIFGALGLGTVIVLGKIFSVVSTLVTGLGLLGTAIKAIAVWAWANPMLAALGAIAAVLGVVTRGFGLLRESPEVAASQRSERAGQNLQRLRAAPGQQVPRQDFIQAIGERDALHIAQLDMAGSHRFMQQRINETTGQIATLEGTNPHLSELRIRQGLQATEGQSWFDRLPFPSGTNTPRLRRILAPLGVNPNPLIRAHQSLMPGDISVLENDREFQAMPEAHRHLLRQLHGSNTNLGGESLGEERINQLARLFSGQGQLRLLRERLETLQNAQRNGVPNLLAGAPQGGGLFGRAFQSMINSSSHNPNFVMRLPIQNQPAYSAISELYSKIQLSALKPDDSLHRIEELQQQGNDIAEANGMAIQQIVNNTNPAGAPMPGRSGLWRNFNGFE